MQSDAEMRLRRLEEMWAEALRRLQEAERTAERTSERLDRTG